MSATGQTLEMDAGNTELVTIPVLDKNGLAVNLAGGSAQWWAGLLNNGINPQPLVKKSTADASLSIITQGLDSQNHTIYALQFTIRPSDTASLVPLSAYYHEAEATDAAGNVSTITKGTFKLNPTMIR